MRCQADASLRAGILTLPESLRLMPRPKRPNLVLVFEAIREARTENTPHPASDGTPAIQPGAPASKGNHGAAKQQSGAG